MSGIRPTGKAVARRPACRWGLFPPRPAWGLVARPTPDR